MYLLGIVCRAKKNIHQTLKPTNLNSEPAVVTVTLVFWRGHIDSPAHTQFFQAYIVIFWSWDLHISNCILIWETDSF